MKRILLASIAVTGIAGGVAIAQPELSPLLSVYNADNVTFYTGRIVYPAGAVGNSFHAMGLVYSTIAVVPSAGSVTSEQILGTFSLPANALDTTGRRLRIRAVFHCGTNGDNKTLTLYFGASSITTGVVTTSNKNAVLNLEVVKSGSSTQIVTGTGFLDTTVITPYVNASGTDVDTAAIVIKATGTEGTGTASGIVLDDFSIEYMN